VRRAVIFALSLCLALVVGVSADPRSDLPKIDIIYPPFGTIFDRTRSEITQANVDTALIRVAGQTRASFQAEWDREGPAYLSLVLDSVGLAFPYREMQAYLTVTHVGTMSMPLMVNVRQYLERGSDAPPDGDFSEKLFHELMHHYVAPVNATSALRRKYRDEPPVVLNHLHVMALEKFALLRLGKKAELAFLDREYRTDPSPSYYKRAWEIVNQEGYQAFVAELATLASKGSPSPR
jgi:hypothetical protein